MVEDTEVQLVAPDGDVVAATDVPEVMPEPNDIERLVSEVKSGKWGKGPAAYRRLKAHGHDADAVMAEVNK